MGKKGLSMKTSKNKNEKHKKDFNSWLNVLRPKVYITDSSSFKSLVQELTGNRTSSSSPPPMIISSALSPSMEEPQVVENLIPSNYIHLDHQDHHHILVVEPESSTDGTTNGTDIASADDCSSDDRHQVLLATTNHHHQDHHHHHHHQPDDQAADDQFWLDDTSLLEDMMANQQDHQVDLLAFGSLESWLSDIDNHHPYNNSFCNTTGFVQNEHEVSIYDYELSGLLCN